MAERWDPAWDARIGNDDEDEIAEGVEIRLVPDPDNANKPRAVIVPRSIRNAGQDQALTYGELQECAAAISRLADELEKLVATARLVGCSWAGIGWSIGTSGEAARQRFGKIDE